MGAGTPRGREDAGNCQRAGHASAIAISPAETAELDQRLQSAVGPDGQADVLAAFLQRQREALGRGVLDIPGPELVARLSDLTDVVVACIFELACAGAGIGAEEPCPVAVLATGGYGRRQLCLHSDIDLAIVPSPHGGDALDRLVRHIHRVVVEVLGDRLGLLVGYAFRPVSDCPSFDHATQTALLDSRFVVGQRALFAAMRTALRQHIDVLDYLRRKQRETDLRRARFGDLPYVLEPNLKHAAGGLRDLQTTRWAAAVRYNVEVVDEALDELVRRSIVMAEERDRVLEAEAFLLQIRNWLHARCREQADTLYREQQSALARLVGYEADGAPSPTQALMRTYYSHTDAILSLSERAAQAIIEDPLPLAPGLVASDGRLQLTQPHLPETGAAGILRTYGLVQRYELRPSHAVAAAVSRAARQIPARVPFCPETRDLLLGILSRRGGVAAALTGLWRCELLPRMIPELSGAEALVPADPSHSQTVGGHTLEVIAQIEAIPDLPESPYEQLRDAYADIERHDLLMLAALLHDIGKRTPDDPHAEEGARLAADATERIGLPPQERDVVARLVRDHLLMARVSRLQDITLPAAIEAFAGHLGSMDMLNMLYVLTYADTKAVSPGAWTDVTRQQTDDLYFRAFKYLATDASHPHAAEHVERIRDEAVRRLRAGGRLGEAAIGRHLSGMPASYVLNTSVGAIAEHIALVERVPREHLVVDFYNEPDKQFTELTVSCKDDPKPGLFSKIAGTLYANDIAIHTAQIYTRERDNTVLDILWVDFHGQQISEAKQASLRRDLFQALKKGQPVRDLIASKRRPAPRPVVVRRLQVSNDRDADHTVVELAADDQPGLLFRAAEALAAVGLNIHSARITTWHGQAEDSFYVKDAQGRKPTDAEAQQLAQRLSEVLARR